ncbi:hypothetical protein [Actinomadura montaniterrae]|uniref:hypothetical protein n=1 Tax=Actinomadura montaniterrae TaxID=1803903 RepID=UPI001CEF85C0|nr:hypothetical protein [Actinomadura montaniterrae]
MTLFASSGAGVPADQQGVASGLASSAKEIGGALGLAVFVAIANGPGDLLHGLHAVGWVAAAATAAGGLAALALKPSRPGGTERESLPLEGALK